MNLVKGMTVVLGGTTLLCCGVPTAFCAIVAIVNAIAK